MSLWSMAKFSHFWLFLHTPGSQGSLITVSGELPLVMSRKIIIVTINQIRHFGYFVLICFQRNDLMHNQFFYWHGCFCKFIYLFIMWCGCFCNNIFAVQLESTSNWIWKREYNCTLGLVGRVSVHPPTN